MNFKQTAESNTASTYQVSSVQLVTDKKLETLKKAFCRSPTALKKHDRSKQCHCLQFAQITVNHNRIYNFYIPQRKIVLIY